jgi:hypothetical protein
MNLSLKGSYVTAGDVVDPLPTHTWLGLVRGGGGRLLQCREEPKSKWP